MIVFCKRRKRFYVLFVATSWEYNGLEPNAFVVELTKQWIGNLLSKMGACAGHTLVVREALDPFSPIKIDFKTGIGGARFSSLP